MSQSFKNGAAIDFQVSHCAEVHLTTLLTTYQDLVSRFTLDSASEFLFGSCTNSLQQPLPSAASVTAPRQSLHNRAEETVSTHGFAEAFRAAEHVCSDRAWRGGTWPLFEMLENKSAKHMEIIDRFLDPIVKNALMRKDTNASVEERPSHDEDGKTLLDHLVDYTSG